jgi:hypothetical protein
LDAAGADADDDGGDDDEDEGVDDEDGNGSDGAMAEDGDFELHVAAIPFEAEDGTDVAWDHGIDFGMELCRGRDGGVDDDEDDYDDEDDEVRQQSSHPRRH